MSKKVVFEVGMIRDGIPLVQRRYVESDDLKADPLLVGGLMSAIQDFTRTTFSDIPEVFQMAKFTACLHRVEIGNGDCYLLYAICNSGTETKVIRRHLISLASEVNNWQKILFDTFIDPRELERLYPVFDKKFQILNQDSTDRAHRKLARF